MHTKEDILQAFGRLLDVQERLRKECPWDRKQTNESLRSNTIEEVYELCDALLKDDRRNICKELGDVMEHVLFYSIIGSETNDFDIADVCNQEADKLMFRHPFIDWTGWKGDPKEQVNNGATATAEDAEIPTTEQAVAETWEQIKQREKDGNESVLSGVPAALPSMIKAFRVQEKASNVGFDWPQREDVWKKVEEELDELKVELQKGDRDHSTRELGDFFFSIINAARLYHLNPENALELTNQKFIRRFNYVEKTAAEEQKLLKDMTLSQMDILWNDAKQLEKEGKLT